MKTFFTQPIGQLGRQNSIAFIVLSVAFLVIGLGDVDIPAGLGNFLNFLDVLNLFNFFVKF